MKYFPISPIGEDGSDIRKRADKINQVDLITQTIIDYIVES